MNVVFADVVFGVLEESKGQKQVLTLTQPTKTEEQLEVVIMLSCKRSLACDRRQVPRSCDMIPGVYTTALDCLSHGYDECQ